MVVRTIGQTLSIVLFTLATPLCLFAATINSNSCSRTDVQTAINAANNGDSVIIPAGSCTWDSGIALSGKGVKIQGMGAGGLVGYSNTSVSIGTGVKTFTTQSELKFKVGDTLKVIYTANGTNLMQGQVTSYSGTTLQLNVTNTGGSGTMSFWTLSTLPSTIITNNIASGVVFDISEDTAYSVKLSGIHFVQGTGSGHLNINYTSGGKPVLIHENWFSMGGGARAILADTSRGVIYRNSFDSGFSSVFPADNADDQAIGVKPLSLSSSWTTPDTMGMNDTTGTNNLYIEDNYFAGMYLQAIDADDNARVVIRHNIFNNSGTVAHGEDTSTYGVRHFEFYNNTFVFNDVGPDTYNVNRWFYDRGGTGVITDNIMSNISSSMWGTKSEIVLTIQNIRRSAQGNCSTTYPVSHQVGQGNNGVIDFTDPLYIWNTTGGNPVVDLEDYDPDECGNNQTVTNYIKAGRDYIIGVPKPGYTKYTYPHPLTMRLSPPQNLRVIQ